MRGRRSRRLSMAAGKLAALGTGIGPVAAEANFHMNRSAPARSLAPHLGWLWAFALAATTLPPSVLSAQNDAARGALESSSLLTTYTEALTHNAAYRAQLSATRSVAELERVSAGRLLPQVGLGASYDYGREDIRGDYYGVRSVRSEDDYGQGLVGVKLTQPLYQPELWITRDQATLKLSQARFALEKVEDQLMIDVVGAYLAVLAAQDARRLAQAESAAVEKQLGQIRARGEAGLALEADVLAASAQHSTALANLVQAEGQVDIATSTLDLTVGRPVRGLRVLPEGMVLSRPEPADSQSWVTRARSQNLDVVQARIAAQMAELDAEKARYARMPKIAAVGSASYLDLDGGISGERSEKEARIGVDFTVPLYSGGSIQAAIAAAEAGVESARALVEAAEAKAERDARQAYSSLLNSLNKVPARWDAVTAARAAENATMSGFDAGTRTNADVLRALEERFDSERSYSDARYVYILDSLRLKMAAGNLVSSDLGPFDRLLRTIAESP